MLASLLEVGGRVEDELEERCRAICSERWDEILWVTLGPATVTAAVTHDDTCSGKRMESDLLEWRTARIN